MENAFFQNPASLATGVPDWNFDGDISAKVNPEPGMAPGNSVSELETDGGVGFSNGNWGIGASYILQKASVDGAISIFDANGSPVSSKMSSEATLQQLSLPLAARFSKRWSFGITPSFLTHSQSLGIKGATDKVANNPHSTAFGFTLGSMLALNRNMRFGSWFRIPTTLYEQLNFSASVSGTTINYSEDFALRYPWVWTLGFAYEISKRTSIFLENDLIGPTENGYLLSYDTLSSAVGDRNLVLKGRHTVAEPHWGLRERLSEKFTLHFGGYYEPSRWERYRGKLHTTGGLSAKVFDWLEIIGGVDVAQKFTHVFFTFR